MTVMSWDELIKNSAGSFDPLPNGDYDITVVNTEAAQTQNGKAMVKAKFRVQGGPHDGRHIWNQFVISPENPNALSFFFQHMKVFGMDENFFAQLPPVNADLGANDPSLQYIASTMLNRSARVTINQRSWNGQMRNNVTAIKASLGPIGTIAPQAAAPGIPATIPQPVPMQAPALAQPVPQQAIVPQPAAVPAAPAAPPAPPVPAPAPQYAPAPTQPAGQQPMLQQPPAPAPASAPPASPAPQVIGPPAQPPIAPPAPQPMHAPEPQAPPQELAF